MYLAWNTNLSVVRFSLLSRSLVDTTALAWIRFKYTKYTTVHSYIRVIPLDIDVIWIKSIDVLIFRSLYILLMPVVHVQLDFAPSHGIRLLADDDCIDIRSFILRSIKQITYARLIYILFIVYISWPIHFVMFACTRVCLFVFGFVWSRRRQFNDSMKWSKYMLSEL